MKKKRINAPHRSIGIQFKCGAAVALIGLAAVVGWAFNITSLKSFARGFISMNPLVAINFILLGCWLSLHSRSRSKYIVPLTIALLSFNAFLIIPKVIELFHPLSFKVDHLLFAEQTLGTNMIAPATTVSFLLVSIALATSFLKDKGYLFQSLIIATFAVSEIYLCGYLFDYSSLIGASVLTPMALQTSISFVILSLGLLFTYPEKGFMRPLMSKKLGGIMARRLLPFIIFIPMCTGALRIFGQRLNLYNTELGVAIHVVVIGVLSFLLAYYFAKKLNEIDSIRKGHEDDLVQAGKLLQQSESLLEETASLAKVGGWQYTIADNRLSYTKQIYSIREMSADTEVAFDDAVSAYTPESSRRLLEHYQRALKEGTPYDAEAKLITAKNREIWVRIKGHAIHDESGTITGVRGTLQDIDESKKKEILVQESNEIIQEQNKRLMNFTHIVSHNLRTHAGNIKSTLSIFEDEENEQEKAEILQMTKRAADSLSQTIADLSEIVSTQSASKQLKTVLYFEDVFSVARNVLNTEIRASQAIIKTDFSECEKVEYVPAYLESIFHNFLSNALKYRKPDIAPEVTIRTSIEENGKVAMTFTDNGLGIDLAKYKEKLFGMYKTFHNHPDSTGVGLFLTKNQVESLGGNILVDSEVNTGTTFKILF